MSTPAISIIMPVFNGGELLAESVRSVLAQSFRDFELILVDDGSTDGCIELVRALDPRILILHQHNQGASAASQTGLLHAASDLVAFLDQDDLWSVDKLETQVRLLRSDPSLALVFSATRFIGPASEPLPLPAKKWDGPTDFDHLLRDFVIGNTSSVAVRRQDALDAGGFDPSFRFMYDLDLFLRIGLLPRRRLLGDSSTTTFYRRHPEQMSRQWDSMVEEWERLLAKISLLEPAGFKRCEAEARMNMARYFSYLCYETGAPLRGLSILARSAGHAPLRFASDKRNWLVSAACCASAVLPAPAVRRLAALQGRLSRRNGIPTPSLRSIGQ